MNNLRTCPSSLEWNPVRRICSKKCGPGRARHGTTGRCRKLENLNVQSPRQVAANRDQLRDRLVESHSRMQALKKENDELRKENGQLIDEIKQLRFQASRGGSTLSYNNVVKQAFNNAPPPYRRKKKRFTPIGNLGWAT